MNHHNNKWNFADCLLSIYYAQGEVGDVRPICTCKELAREELAEKFKIEVDEIDMNCDHQCSSDCRHKGCPCQEDHYCQNSVL